MIRQKYRDAFVESGQGIGQTFKSRFFGLRIDYSFASETVEILDHEILKSPISDHFPVVTTIATKPRTP